MLLSPQDSHESPEGNVDKSRFDRLLMFSVLTDPHCWKLFQRSLSWRFIAPSVLQILSPISSAILHVFLSAVAIILKFQYYNHIRGDNKKYSYGGSLSEKKGSIWLMSKKSAINLLKSGRMDEQKEKNSYNDHQNKQKTQMGYISRC